jgi:iron complex transport system substrate-binding protein
MRVVSFVPGATAALAALGLRQQLVGVTHECGQVADLSGVDARVLTRSRVPTGGNGAVIDQAVRNAHANKNDLWVLDAQGLLALEPDVVVVPVDQPEGRTPCLLSFIEIRHVTSTMTRAPRLVAFGSSNLQEVFGSIRALGEALGPGAESARFAADLRTRVENVRSMVSRAFKRPRVALLSWVNPPIGSAGLLAQLVLLAGGEPVAGDPGGRPKAFEWPQLLGLKPQVLVLAPCGFTLERTRVEAESLRRIPGMAESQAARWGQIHIVDALSHFSAPGIGSVRAFEILAALIHPELPWPDAILPGPAARHVGLD